MKNTIILFYLSVLAIGCSNTKSALPKKESKSEVSSPSNLSQSKTMLQNGIDFFAQGSQPTNWQLTINYDDTVRFSADDGLALKFAYNQLKKEFLPEKTVYTVQLKAGKVVINILDKICTVPTMREVFKKEVNINFNGIVYTGCGKFLGDDNLNNKWVLEKIGNAAINLNEYSKVPSFQFNILEGKLSGNDGCNNIGGTIEVQGKRIQFSSLFSTRMACNKKSIDKIIADQISGKMVSYYFKDNKLYLYLLDDSLLVFKKEGSL